MSDITDLRNNYRYSAFPDLVENVIYPRCDDVHVTTRADNSEFIDPLLKLYVGRPMMITNNVDVINSLNNGTVGKFQWIQLVNDHRDVFKINIDGYYIFCVKAKNVEYIELQLEDKTYIKIKPEERIARAEITLPEAGCIKITIHREIITR